MTDFLVGTRKVEPSKPWYVCCATCDRPVAGDFHTKDAAVRFATATSAQACPFCNAK